jgi:hypothetical protein
MDHYFKENSNEKKSSQCTFIFYESFLGKKIMWPLGCPYFKVEIIKWLIYFIFNIRFGSHII